MKVELPKYDGDERQCITWINKAEEYLDIHNIHYDDEKIKYASMHLEGNATTGTYGGRILQEYVLITGLASGTTSSKYSKALKKKTSLLRSQGYNKKTVSMSTPVTGKCCQLES